MARRRLTATVTAALVITAALVTAPAQQAQASRPTGDVVGALGWSPCADETLRKAGMECATLVVPEDRRQPTGTTVELALVRHRSTGTADQRIGSLVFNPGGPGGSGLASIPWVWAGLPEPVQQRFDLVTWDPRGVGQTSGALADRACRTVWPDRPLTGPVDWAAVTRDLALRTAKANAACQRAYGDALAHVSTMENVADLERIRVALGEERLTYWGLSYGTRIGYVYALLHPDRIRAMVLDGSIDPSSRYVDLMEGGSAPDQAFGPFANVYPESAARFQEVLDRLESGPVPLPDGQVLDRWAVIDFVFALIPQQQQYPTIAMVVDAWHDALFAEGDAQAAGAELGAAAVAQVRQLPGQAGGTFSVTNCNDYADRPSVRRIIASVREQDRLGPLNGATTASMYGVGCAGFTFEPDPIPRITGAGSEVPLLILGSTRDGSTIVQWTARMSRAFPASRTVTYAGGQHVTWGAFAGSACLDRVANRYVIETVLPATDRGCPNSLAVAQ